MMKNFGEKWEYKAGNDKQQVMRTIINDANTSDEEARIIIETAAMHHLFSILLWFLVLYQNYNLILVHQALKLGY